MTWGKRAFDVCGALLGLLTFWPVFLLIAVCILVEDGTPVFFRQERVGRNDRRFRMWKFRTMIAGAEHRGRAITVGADPRITRVGRWLRRAKLDEFPQLLNVLRGEMSLVGPRPEVPRYVALYTEAERAVLRLTPGITDPASIRYAAESEELAAAADPERLYVEEIMPEKIRLNLAYAAHATPWTDFKVVLSTMRRLAAPGAGAGGAPVAPVAPVAPAAPPSNTSSPSQGPLVESTIRT
jgi:lipopolysaccharide/colanic/teichoic acid biosynthesis glycosyltransferase